MPSNILHWVMNFLATGRLCFDSSLHKIACSFSDGINSPDLKAFHLVKFKRFV